MARRKLTDAQVSQVRLAYETSRKSMPALAKQFAVSLSTIWEIIRGRCYKEIPALVCPHCKRAIR